MPRPFLEDFGLVVETNYTLQLHKRIRELLNTTIDRFPASEPTRLNENLLHTLEHSDYFVSELGTGTRVLLFLTTTPDGPATFMLNAENAIFYLNVHFPQTNLTQFHNETLIDGEIRFSTDPTQVSLFIRTAKVPICSI
jgi:hypothetical protein